MLLDVRVGVVEEIETAVDVGELADAQAVAGVELGLKVVAASVAHVGELEKIRRREQNLNVLLGDDDDGCVNVLDEQLQRVVVDALDGDFVLPRLLEAGEHGVEVRAARGENHLVGGNFHAVGDQEHIAQEILSKTKLVN